MFLLLDYISTCVFRIECTGFLHKIISFRGEDMETRIALIGIIVESNEAVEQTNELLHEYGEYIVGRMGLPYRTKGINIISVVLDAPESVVSALSGRLGRLKGISVKSMLAKNNIVKTERGI